MPHHSNVPSFQYSIIPVLAYSAIGLFHHSIQESRSPGMEGRPGALLCKTKPIPTTGIASPAFAGAGFAALLAMTGTDGKPTSRAPWAGVEDQLCKTKPISRRANVC